MEKPVKLPTRSRASGFIWDPAIDFSFLFGEVSRLSRRAYDQEMEAIALTRSRWQAPG